VALTPDDLVRMRRAGFKLREIVEMAGDGWTESKLSHYFKKIGVKPDEPIMIFRSSPGQIKHHYPRELLHEMYWDCELSINEIAYELDIGSRSVDYIFRRLEIPRRSYAESRRIAVRRNPHVMVPLLRSDPEKLRRAREARRQKARRRRAVNERKRLWEAQRLPEDKQAELERRRQRREESKREQEAA
jgi:hypothetical protein